MKYSQSHENGGAALQKHNFVIVEYGRTQISYRSHISSKKFCVYGVQSQLLSCSKYSANGIGTARLECLNVHQLRRALPVAEGVRLIDLKLNHVHHRTSRVVSPTLEASILIQPQLERRFRIDIDVVLSFRLKPFYALCSTSIPAFA